MTTCTCRRGGRRGWSNGSAACITAASACQLTLAIALGREVVRVLLGRYDGTEQSDVEGRQDIGGLANQLQAADVPQHAANRAVDERLTTRASATGISGLPSTIT